MASDAEESGFEDDSAYKYPSTSESNEEDEALLDDVESDEAPPRTVASVKERSGCKCGCLEGKDLEITMLLQSLSKMTKREKHKKEERTVNYYTDQPFKMLPSYLTWERLYNDYLTRYSTIDSSPGGCPSYISFFQIAKKCCPDIRIRSARSNVCDRCSIFKMRFKHMTTDTTESELRGREFGEHVENARAMRAQNVRDRDEAVDTHYVVTMDFSQNLTLPNDPQTPSAWYFLSLISVSVFGVFLANDNRQRNFVYSERKGGKGSNEVISMNKNNAVMMYFRWLVDAGYLEEANVMVFVKEHTKNSCDRAFGQIKRKYNRNECWAVAQAEGLVQDSAASNICVMLEDNVHSFQDFKRALSVLYKDLPKIKKFQLFRMPKTAPGVIECRVKPQGRIETFNIRRKSKEPVANSAALDLLATIKPLPPPLENPEKIHDIHQKILPSNANGESYLYQTMWQPVPNAVMSSAT
ncbi:hypothetical protein PR001_g11736 [Phytophthora rubi]|uniref:DUF7869 domain-containing protein n=1 Tax=Phytophthora rubi TaxID=129364 RepID=A0A6A3MFS6_9STRA|nr:hypothetical protein PR001_g11736 [Phytophthora rubi]